MAGAFPSLIACLPPNPASQPVCFWTVVLAAEANIPFSYLKFRSEVKLKWSVQMRKGQLKR